MNGIQIWEYASDRDVVNFMSIRAMKAGTLYPLLHSLVNQKCLESYEKEVNGKLRKYYHLTVVGKTLLNTKTKVWREYSHAIVSVIGGEAYDG